MGNPNTWLDSDTTQLSDGDIIRLAEKKLKGYTEIYATMQHHVDNSCKESYTKQLRMIIAAITLVNNQSLLNHSHYDYDYVNKAI